MGERYNKVQLKSTLDPRSVSKYHCHILIPHRYYFIFVPDIEGITLFEKLDARGYFIFLGAHGHTRYVRERNLSDKLREGMRRNCFKDRRHFTNAVCWNHAIVTKAFLP